MPNHFFYADKPRLYRRASANGPPDKLEGAMMQTLHSRRPCWLSARFASRRAQPTLHSLEFVCLGRRYAPPSVTLRRPSSPKVAKPLLTRRPSLRKSALAFDLLHTLLRSRLTPPHSLLQPAKSRLILIKEKELLRKDDKRPPGKLEGAWSGSPGKLEGTRPNVLRLKPPHCIKTITPFWVMTYYIAFVGASVLPSGYTAAVRSAVSSRLASLDSSSVVVVSGGAQGVDTVAENVALQMGCLLYTSDAADE